MENQDTIGGPVLDVAERLCRNDLDHDDARKWLLEQMWPPYDAKNQDCRLAALCWWYLGIAGQGGAVEPYRRALYFLVGNVWGFDVPKDTIEPSETQLASTYQQMRMEAAQSKAARQ